nr:PREDICTED: uncharacterized protein LOC106706272 [Latimeria chalumnae]|eukprot:XP_014352422.1 PREDICTED: uncharacterized protein LOC106706272 [Latimeria chalumnae]
MDSLENQPRRSNLHIVGLLEGSEGKGPVDFFQIWLPKLLDLPLNPNSIEIEWAHWTMQPKPSPSESPRMLICKLLRFRDKEMILRAAHVKGPLMFQNEQIFIFPDVSAELFQKQKTFDRVKRTCKDLANPFALLPIWHFKRKNPTPYETYAKKQHYNHDDQPPLSTFFSPKSPSPYTAEKVKKMLQSAQHVSLTLDILTDRRCHSYLAIMAHTFVKCVSPMTLVAFKSFKGSHTRIQIAEEIEHAIDENNLAGKVQYILTDNSAKMKKAFAALKDLQCECNSEMMAETVEDCNLDETLWQDLDASESDDVERVRNNCYGQLRRFHIDYGHSNLILTPKETLILMEILEILQPFAAATDLTQGNHTTIGCVVPCVVSLYWILKDQVQIIRYNIAVTKALLGSLCRRFSGLLQNVGLLASPNEDRNQPFMEKIYLVASILDPAFCFQRFEEVRISEKEKQRLKESITELAIQEVEATVQNQTQESQCGPPKKKTWLTLFSSYQPCPTVSQWLF